MTDTIQPNVTRLVNAEFLHCKKLKSCHIKADCDSYMYYYSMLVYDANDPTLFSLSQNALQSSPSIRI